MDKYTITMLITDPEVDRSAIVYALNDLGIGEVVSVAKEVPDDYGMIPDDDGTIEED